MYLIDSNIIIYSAEPEFEFLFRWVKDPNNFASSVSIVETLGYKGLKPKQAQYFKSIFNTLKIFPVSGEVINKAVEIRQIKTIKLADSLIAAATLVLDIRLISRNTKDFQDIPSLTVVNPFEAMG